MSSLTPREIAEKQIRRSQAASGDYVKGVQSTTKSPMQLAKSKKQKLRQNFNKAVDDGKWEAGLDAVSDDEWKRITAAKGGSRYGSGVSEASAKIIAFQEEFIPFVRQVQTEVNAMDDLTLEARMQKMVENAKRLSQFKRTRRRR